MSEDLLLPDGSVLVHVGPHKTGTTAVQDGFHQTREQHAAHGLFYPGKRKQPYAEVQALLRHRGRLGSVVGDRDLWERFAHRVRGVSDRKVVISCESLDHATPTQIAELVADLGGPERVHVVRMMRRLDKLLPSQWQQSVVNGTRRGYDAWLHKILEQPSEGFWYGHGYARQAEEWVRVLGPEHVSLVVVDDREPRGQLEIFERLVGLPDGFLPLGSKTSNRSLTPSEVALVQGLSRAMLSRHWSPQAHYALVRAGVKYAVKNIPVAPDSPRLGLPPWAVAPVVERAESEIAAVRRLGVRVVGDLDSLHIDPSQVRVTGKDVSRPDVPVSTVAVALVGLVDSARRRSSDELVVSPAQAAASVDIGRRRPTEWPVSQVAGQTLIWMLVVRVLVRLIGRGRAQRLLGERVDAVLDGGSQDDGLTWGTLFATGPAAQLQRKLTKQERKILQLAVPEANRAGWDEDDVERYVWRAAARALAAGPPSRTSGRGSGAGRSPAVSVRTGVRALLGATMATTDVERARRLAQQWRPAIRTPAVTVVRNLLARPIRWARARY